MGRRNEQCDKVCRILDNVLANRPTERDALIVATRKAFDALEFRGRYDYFWEEVKSAGMKGKETEVHHSGRVFRIREVAQ